MTTKPRRRSPWPLLLTLLLIGVVAVAGAFALVRGPGGDGDDAMPTFSVRRGPLTISVTQAGTIQALDQDIIKSEDEGQTTIIYLIPEGTRVKKGELLVELDASGLEDSLVDQNIRVQNAEAAFIRARENLAVVKNQAKSDISKAELDAQFAHDDLQQYINGELPQLIKESQSRITLAQEELERASEKVTWSEKLYEEKYISQTELEADRLTYNRASLEHELAVAALALLEEYTSQRQLAQLESDIEQATLALERVQLKASADVVQADADLAAKEAELKQQQAKQTKVVEQIKKTKIYASRDGLVVYATSAKSSWRGNETPLDEGQSIREREELIYLPTADQMMAQVQIHESNLEKIRVGLPVRISIDALPGRTYGGRVAKIAPLPNAHSMRMNPNLKVYMTEIHLEGDNGELRTGMSCQAEVVIDDLAEATYVPVQAVTRLDGRTTVYVREGDGFEPRPVEIGLDNNRMVHVVSGLQPGQDVLLTPPFDAAGPEMSDAPLAQREETTPSAPKAEKERAAASTGGQNFSEADRQAMRERFEKMSPEEREAARKRWSGASGAPPGGVQP